MRGSKGVPNVHYDYDHWVVDGRLYVRIEAHEWERATVDSFRLGARRYAERFLLKLGIEVPRSSRARPLLEEWDRALDYAIDMPVALVFRTVEPVVRVEVPA